MFCSISFTGHFVASGSFQDAIHLPTQLVFFYFIYIILFYLNLREMFNRPIRIDGNWTIIGSDECVESFRKITYYNNWWVLKFELLIFWLFIPLPTQLVSDTETCKSLEYWNCDGWAGPPCAQPILISEFLM